MLLFYIYIKHCVFLLVGGIFILTTNVTMIFNGVLDSEVNNSSELVLMLDVSWYVRGAFGKLLAWSFISVTDLQTLSCLVSV